jgi:hypothetical protein
VTNEQTDKDTVTNTSAKTFSAAVTAKVTAGFVSASLTVKDQMTWTAQQSREVSNGDSTSASVSIGEPAFGYTGPVAIAVYQDRLYNTFAFAPILDNNQLLGGFIGDSHGKPIAGEPVRMTIAGRIMQTYTDPHGNYHFYGTVKAKQSHATLFLRGQAHQIVIGPKVKTNFTLPPRKTIIHHAS